MAQDIVGGCNEIPVIVRPREGTVPGPHGPAAAEAICAVHEQEAVVRARFAHAHVVGGIDLEHELAVHDVGIDRPSGGG